jgi:hypothetical protein
MAKKVTDNDAFAGGIAAYAVVQSLLNCLEDTGMSRRQVIGVIEDAARAIEVVSQEMKPKHPAMARAVLLLRSMAARRQANPANDADELFASTVLNLAAKNQLAGS